MPFRAQLNKKFRNKILYYLAFSMLVPLLVWGLLVYRESLADHQELLERQLQQSAQVVYLQSSHWHENNLTLMNFLIREISDRQSRSEWPQVLQNIVLSEPAIMGAHIADVNGDNVARSDAQPSQNYADRNYFQHALKGEIFSEALIGRTYHQPLLCTAAPIYKQGQVRYVATLCTFLEKLNEIIGTLRIGKTGHAMLIDSTGRPLAHPELDSFTLSKDQKPNEFLENIGQLPDGKHRFTANQIEYTAFVYQTANGWKAVAFQAQSEITSLSKATMTWPFTVGFLVICAFIVLTYFFVDHITSPLYRLAETVRRFGLGDLKAQAEVRSKDELGILAITFNSMAKQIRATIEELKTKEHLLAKHRDELHQKVIDQSQKLLYSSKMSSLGEMAGGIAHEINNPLAIISLKAQALQLGLANGKLTRESAIELATQVESTCLRIHKIIRGLRNFSRDGSRDPMVRESLATILAEAENLCSESLRSRGIALEINCPAELSLEGQSVPLSQVFLNLIMNSCDAVAKLSEKWIRVECGQDQNDLIIKITDSGRGIPESICSQMMQPFFTTKAVGRGTGLGLSISNGIIEQHQGKLVYNRDSEHTQFIVQLPKVQGKMTDQEKPWTESRPQA